MTNDNLYSFGNAICVQAGKDYKEAIEDIQKGLALIENAKKVISECEDFFKSDSFHELSGGANGELVMSMIKERLGYTYE